MASPPGNSKNTRNFEFINATGSTRPDPVSRPFIRSHVMREANRMPSQKMAESSSDTYEYHNLSQKFRFGSAGLQLIPNSPRRKITRRKSEGSLKFNFSKDSVTEAVDSMGTENTLPSISGIEGDGSTSATLELIYEEQNVNSQGLTYAFGSSHGTLDKENPPSETANSSIGAIFLASNLQGSRAEEMLNPFDPLVISRPQRVQQLLLHYQNYFIHSSSLTRVFAKTCYDLFIQDATFRSVILCIAADNLNLLEHVGDCVESLYWKNEAIKTINERLNESTSKLTAATVAAVASLTSYEAMNGSLLSVQTHINGLEQIVNVLGGLNNIRSSHLLCLIAWADINSANALSTLPRFPLIDILQNDPMSESAIQVSKPYLSNLDERLKDLFADIQSLSRLLEDKNASELDQLSSTNTVYLTKRRLIYALASSTDYFDHLKLEQTCCLAGLIFIECFLCRTSPNSVIIRRLVEKLENAIAEQLPSTGGPRSHNGSTKFLLWSVCVGAIAAASNRRWFIERIVANNFMKQDWGEVKETLQQICFPEFIVENTARYVWEEVHELMGLERLP
ncbi:fungal-specific transcription factor domain-containing protein [Xylogone sp. PMI_703]|nr:fungal-specific transcription factor domain-containing protein [Xylogone sp. PMI_703]